MRRRDFFTLSAGAAAWPLVASAQPAGAMHRIGVLMSLAPGDDESQARLAAFRQALQDLGRSDGRNVVMDVRWAMDDAERARSLAVELVALAPDVMLASGNTAASALHRATSALPIVFVQVADPIGERLVASMERPGGNITGFASIENGMSARWLELLKEAAPNVTRALVIRDPATAAGTGQFRAIAVRAPALRVELSSVGVRDAGEIERAVVELSREPNGGLIVTTSTRASAHRDLLIALAARHRLPAVYPFRFYAESGGLISFGPDWIDQYRRAAGTVDRILKGAKPADLPVQTPAKYDLVINRKTALALGLDLRALLHFADDVIQ
jgi:putative ABC transport system substrate-binding protein